MMNQIFMVGRLTSKPEVIKSEEGKERSLFTLAVPRSYKNADGEYETDFVDCISWGNVASSVSEYSEKGDLIGIKGRIQTNTYETESGEKKKATQVVAERISFLASSKSKDIETPDDDLDM